MYCFKSLFLKSKEAKIQRMHKNIFTKLPSFRVSVKSFIFDKTCKHCKTCERFPNWEA